MEDVKSLSDADLRSELIRLGFTPGPVTNTTRNILQKKLFKLRSEQKKIPKRASIAVPSRKVLGLSSDESENDTGARSAKTRQVNPRRRSALGRLKTSTRRRSAPPSKAESDDDSNDEENVDNDLPSKYSFLRRNESPKLQPNDVHSAGGIGKPQAQVRMPDVKKPLSQTYKPHNDSSAGNRPSPFLDTRRPAEAAESQLEKPKIKRNSSIFSRRSFLGSQPTGNEFSDSDVDREVTDLDGPKIPFGASKTDLPRPKSNVSGRHPIQTSFRPDRSDMNRTFNVESENKPDKAVDDSSVLRRRRSLNSTPKTSTPRKSHSFNRTNPESVIGNRANSTKRNEITNQSGLRRGDVSSDPSLPEQVFATEENLSSSLGSKYSHVISTVLLVGAFMFFVILGVLYFSVGSEDVPDKRLLIGCSGALCDQDVEYKLRRAVFDKLCERTGFYQCGYLEAGEDKKMRKEDMVKLLEDMFATEQTKADDAFWADDMLEKVLEEASKQEWGIRCFDIYGQEIECGKSVHFLSSDHPALPWLCRVRRSASVVLFRLGVIFFTIFFIWLCYLYVKYYWRKQAEEREKVHAMVEKILDMLAKHHRACQNDAKNNHAYQAIPHVRDSIIAPADRQKMQRIWNKAVQFINTHESRVRVETQRIEGEEFQVWRWVQAVPTTHHTSFAPVMELELNPNRVKVWQGTAFDNPEAAVKMRSYSPTECLKIRNMFDISLESTEHWEVVIEDAVLERCGPDHGIVHVAVDKTSTEGCVYVKFLTPEKAGQGFRKLHGSWFDGKLITVKFLRLERYHTRFPHAARTVAPIKPSNNLQKSLSAMNHPSGDDAT